jgi:hypothetical protein
MLCSGLSGGIVGYRENGDFQFGTRTIRLYFSCPRSQERCTANPSMGDYTQLNISGGTFHGPVAAIMRDCASIINSQPPGERKELLETLQKQVGKLISGPPEEKQQLKEMVADRLKELTKGVTSGTPERAWYSVSSKGLLEAAKFVKDFSAEISGTLKSLGSSFWPDFKLTDIFR